MGWWWRRCWRRGAVSGATCMQKRNPAGVLYFHFLPSHSPPLPFTSSLYSSLFLLVLFHGIHLHLMLCWCVFPGIYISIKMARCQLVQYTVHCAQIHIDTHTLGSLGQIQQMYCLALSPCLLVSLSPCLTFLQCLNPYLYYRSETATHTIHLFRIVCCLCLPCCFS